VYFDELGAAEQGACARRILASAQAQETPSAGHALRYLTGAVLASVAALAYDFLSDFSIGFTRPEERTFVGFLAVFVALWGGLGLLADAAERDSARRCAYEISALALPYVHPREDLQ